MSTVVAVLQTVGAVARRLTGRFQQGNSVIEYALLLALIAVACVAMVGVIGNSTASSLSRTASRIP